MHLRVWNAPPRRRDSLCNDHQVARLLKLDHEATAANGVWNSTIDKHEVTWRDWNAVKHIKKTTLRLEGCAPLRTRNAGFEPKVNTSICCGSRKEIPALRLADERAEEPIRARHCRVRLNDKSLVAVQKLHKKR